jgi:hypothetical protein
MCQELSQEFSIGSFIVKISTYKTPLNQVFKIVLVFEKTIKRKLKLDKKAFQKIQKKNIRRTEDVENRNLKYFETLDFIKYLFDFRRCHPFA